MVAANIIQRKEYCVRTPVVRLLNGLLNRDQRIVEWIQIICDPTATSLQLLASDGASGGVPVAPQADVYSLIYELHRASPPVLTTVIGTLALLLQSPALDWRLCVTKFMGRLFYSPRSDIGSQFCPCYVEWLKRSGNIDPGVWAAVVQ